MHKSQKNTTLVLADAENLSYNLRRTGYDVDYVGLRSAFAGHNQVEAHAFATLPSEQALNYAKTYFESAGWRSHLKLSKRVASCQGTRLLANSDNQILLWAGALITQYRPSNLFVCTGDGDLGCDIAEFAKASIPAISMTVVSTQSACSHRLHPQTNPQIDATFLLDGTFIQPIRHA
jgi:hypothetical protein